MEILNGVKEWGGKLDWKRGAVIGGMVGFLLAVIDFGCNFAETVGCSVFLQVLDLSVIWRNSLDKYPLGPIHLIFPIIFMAIFGGVICYLFGVIRRRHK